MDVLAVFKYLYPAPGPYEKRKFHLVYTIFEIYSLDYVYRRPLKRRRDDSMDLLLLYLLSVSIMLKPMP